MSPTHPIAPLAVGQSLGRVGVFSPGIARIPHLAAFLGADAIVQRPGRFARVDTVVGWGRKPNTEAPRRFAERRGVPFVALEDGFVRSVGLGVHGDPPLSLVVDPIGVYYDATTPSALERMLATESDDDPLSDPALVTRARRCIDAMRADHLSKYNDAPVRSLGPGDRPRVLVLDQTAGDVSVRLGGCVPGGFDAMLRAAIDENPGAEIIVKTHPDVASGKKRGHLTDLAARDRVRLLTAPCNPPALLGEVDRVYVMTSLMGLEALMADKPVTCFGAPFYAGWGLTDDRADVPARRVRARTLEQIFAAAYLRYARYVDPETGERCALERVLEHLALQRRTGEANARTMVCVGFSAWKRSFVPSFVWGPGTTVRYAASAAEAERVLDGVDDDEGSDPSTVDVPVERRAPVALLAWGIKDEQALRQLSEDRSVPLWQMEDGFLRSVGLGSDLYSPASLVVDRAGIYYDPQRPSELEQILAEADFSPDELERARELRERIVASRVSKYNVGVARSVGPKRNDPRTVVLVVGQVEDDASIARGCLDVRRNEDLLRAAREARPDAYLIYKPHPDVVSGNRADSLPLDAATPLSDEVVVDATLADCLDVADEVHTMTSLVGFEALLREKRVVVYGQPFYAGWGLTEDRHPHPRRTRRLTLDQLVAGALLRYPRYVHPATGRFTTPERIVDHLSSARRPSSASTNTAARSLVKLTNLTRSLARPNAREKARPAPPRRSNLPDLGVTRALLLQGPAGPFMRRFADELESHGIGATKVNFHAGDVFFFPGPRAVSYGGTAEEFGGWIDRLMEDLGVDGIFLFGDCRPLHRAAIEVAERRGAKVWVFEEGYLRPDWITLEEHGVNGHSHLPRDPDFYRALDLPEAEPAAPVGSSFHLTSWYSTLNALSFTHLNGGFPHYEHHRRLNAWYHTFVWCRNVVRKKRYQIAERDLMPVFENELSGRYFFVPLQVHCDFQILHSPYENVLEFVDEVLRSFAAEADPRDAIVFKHHPMDRAYREYGELFRQKAREHGLEGRLYYCHDLHLPTLLNHARGTVTINSTVGISSMANRTPVKVMGTAIYDMPGLTFQGTLAEFWRAPEPPDRDLYEQFRRYLLKVNQANGSFYKRVDESTPTGIVWFPERPK